jgi:hypothetical protein
MRSWYGWEPIEPIFGFPPKDVIAFAAGAGQPGIGVPPPVLTVGSITVIVAGLFGAVFPALGVSVTVQLPTVPVVVIEIGCGVESVVVMVPPEVLQPVPLTV